MVELGEPKLKDEPIGPLRPYEEDTDRVFMLSNQILEEIKNKIETTRPLLKGTYQVIPHHVFTYELEENRYLEIMAKFTPIPEYIYVGSEGNSLIFPSGASGRINLETNEINTLIEWEELFFESNEAK